MREKREKRDPNNSLIYIYYYNVTNNKGYLNKLTLKHLGNTGAT